MIIFADSNFTSFNILILSAVIVYVGLEIAKAIHGVGDELEKSRKGRIEPEDKNK